MYAVSEGSVQGWSSPEILITGIGGVGGLVLFARQALHRTDPILRLGLLRDRLFRATNIVFPFTTGPFLGSLYLTPIFLQEVLHQSPLGSGRRRSSRRSASPWPLRRSGGSTPGSGRGSWPASAPPA